MELYNEHLGTLIEERDNLCKDIIYYKGEKLNKILIFHLKLKKNGCITYILLV